MKRVSGVFSSTLILRQPGSFDSCDRKVANRIILLEDEIRAETGFLKNAG